MVLNPGQLPPPALRLALPRASSHAAPGDAGRVFPGALRGVRPRSPQPRPAPCRGGGITHKDSPRSVPLAAFPGGAGGPQLCALPAGWAARELRLPTAEHAGLGRSCAWRGGSEPRTVCLCAEERTISQNSFPPFSFSFFFFPSLFCFSEEAAAGLPGMNEISFQGFSRVTFTLSV